MEQNDFFLEQLSANEYRIKTPDLVVTALFNRETDPDKAAQLLADMMNTYALLEKERDANGKLIVAFGIVFNDLTERLGLTESTLFGEGVQDGDTSA